MLRNVSPFAQSFSLAQARGLVADLFTPRPWIYWTDFLASILTGHLAFALTRAMYDWQLQPLWLRLALQTMTFAVQCACYYRSVMFIHEIVHLSERQLRAFRVVWNLLCGIPFLVPSFTYAAHLDHHRRQHYGTDHDGEYLPLGSLSPWWIAVYLSQCLWAPILGLVRFGLVTPLTWLVPPLARWIHQRASSLVMDPRYLRPLPTPAELRAARWQELACLAFLVACVAIPLATGRPLIVLAIHAYLTAVVLVFMNSLRTLAAHRYTSSGHGETFLAQMLDSVTLDSDSPAAILLNPVGLRYHATHHLFPSLPYHNIAAAHRRLLAGLPANSPYHQTVERSLLKVLADLLRRAANSRRPTASGVRSPRLTRNPLVSG
jgi:fatty acid desaturase